MHRIKYPFSCLVVAMGLVACDDRDRESKAEKWMSSEKLRIANIQLPPVPEVIDTPPASYVAKVQDPFDPSRVAAGAGLGAGLSKAGFLFTDAPIASLSIVGFISGSNAGRTAIVRAGDVYRSVRQGDRIGEQAAIVKQIEDRGLLLTIDGNVNQWILRNK